MSVGFDPVRLGPKRRRIDPLMGGVVAVSIALGIAVVKPWEPGSSPAVPGPSVAAVAGTATAPSTSPTPRPTARIARVPTPAGNPPPAWAAIEPAIAAHDTWGGRVILVGRRVGVGSGASPSFVERWAATTPDPDGFDTAFLAREDQAVVALGITFPPGLDPLDVRIWLVHANDELEWIDARPLQRGHSDGAFTFVRFGPAGAGFQPWDAGTYRVDVLAGDEVHRIVLQIPGRFGNVPAPDDWAPTEENLVAPDASDPSEVRAGLFATVDGVGVPLTNSTGPLLGEEEAWRDVIPGGPATHTPVVGVAYLPRATGLGVMLTSHAGVRGAVVRRIAPNALFVAQPTLGGISTLHGRTPYVVFAPRVGGAWIPGVYAVTVRWTDAAGLHDETWTTELLPGPLQDPLAAH